MLARGVGATRALSRPALGAAASSGALARCRGAARRGVVPVRRDWAVLRLRCSRRSLPHSGSAPRAQSQPWKIVGFSIYGFTLVNLFVCSTLHHGLEGPPAMERALRIADYCAIYPLIAGVCASVRVARPHAPSHALAPWPGTFTPICLVFLYNSGVGWAIWGTLWFLTIGGVAMTVSAFDHLPKCGAAVTTRQLAGSRVRAGGCR